LNTYILNTIILGAAFLILFGIAEILYHYTKATAEHTRKLVHVGSGLITLLFPIMLHNHWQVLFLSSSFLLILFLSKKFNTLKSINAIDRASVGSFAFPITIYFCFVVFKFYNSTIIFYLPILILAISDPLAALVGKRWPKGKFTSAKESKTLMGSATFFLSAVLLTIILMFLLNDTTRYRIFAALLIAFMATITEAITKNGYDNINVPVIVLITYLIIQ
jgi:phytol kinase